MPSRPKAIGVSKSKSKKKELTESVNLWLEWHVAKDASDDENLLSSNFRLVQEEISPSQDYKVKVPILALLHLAEKYNWLQVLRGPRHRPEDPYELVHFIQILDDLSCL